MAGLHAPGCLRDNPDCPCVTCEFDWFDYDGQCCDSHEKDGTCPIKHCRKRRPEKPIDTTAAAGKE